MTELSTRPEDLESAARRLDTATKEIGAELDLLESRSRALAATWSGDAQRAYDHAHRRWQADYAELVTLLGQCSAAARSASQRYTDTERENASRWRIGR